MMINSIQQDAHQASQSLIAHLVMVVIATGLEVQARPCFEGGDIELCFTKLALNDDESFPDIREQYSYDYALPNEGHKYDVLLGKRELRDLTEEYHKNCTGCYEETDVVDREDHVTQYLSELLVNTDSEITSLQASDVEETVEESRGKEDGYFSFLTGEEKIFEVDGIWSVPAQTIVEEGELLNNA